MFAPGKLLALIRRPETKSDARIFSLICCSFWGLGWLLQDWMDFLWRIPKREWDMVADGYLWIFHLVLGFAGAWLLLNLVVKIF
ncbi:MAG: hypothetical protein ACTHLW_20415, partial [Verrucomicrobiota bacterium]